MKLWIDDYRDAPDDTWVEARKVEQAIRLCANQHWDVISIDHDIENRPDDETFKPVAYFIGLRHLFRHAVQDPWEPKIIVHSDNPAGAKELQMIFKDYGMEAPWQPFTSNEEFKKKYGLE